MEILIVKILAVKIMQNIIVVLVIVVVIIMVVVEILKATTTLRPFPPHHLPYHPIVPFIPDSSAGCAISDSALALWYFLGAPSVYSWFESPHAEEPGTK